MENFYNHFMMVSCFQNVIPDGRTMDKHLSYHHQQPQNQQLVQYLHSFFSLLSTLDNYSRNEIELLFVKEVLRLGPATSKWLDPANKVIGLVTFD